MAKLISADELYKRRGVFADDIGKHGWREAINNLPAAEPERKRGESKIIRCKDCSRWCICHRSDDWFCADAERRE